MTKLICLGDTKSKEVAYHFSLAVDALMVDLHYKDAGMQTIYRLFVKYLCDEILDKDTEDFIALIAVPTRLRLELRHDGDIHGYLDKNYFNYYPKFKEYPHLSYAKLKKYNAAIFEEKLVEERHSYFIYALSMVCVANNINYIMYNQSEPLSLNTTAPKNYYAPHKKDRTLDAMLDIEKTELYYAGLLRDFYFDHCS
jgi:hypothetical protein